MKQENRSMTFPMLRPLALLTATILATCSTALAHEETFSLKRKLRDGESVALPFAADRAVRIDALVRRIDAKHRETTLVLTRPAGGAALEGVEPAQIDRQDLHPATWFPRGIKDGEGHLVLKARGGDVYIESVTADLKATRAVDAPRGVETRKIDRKLRSGESVAIPADPSRLARIDVVVRRLNPAHRETVLELDPGDEEVQVDRQDFHRMGWTMNAQTPSAREIRIQALNGDVLIDSVILTLAATLAKNAERARIVHEDWD
jgi:hypothetical protein